VNEWKSRRVVHTYCCNVIIDISTWMSHVLVLMTNDNIESTIQQVK
jgi:hypothetical protein